MAVTSTDRELIHELEGFGGTLLQPGDDGYEDARRVHNGLIDKRPALIAQCRGVADVVAAVAAARSRGQEIAVRGGGHSIAGLCVADGGVLIDLGSLKGIVVDPTARTAVVQAGVTWAELDRETQLHGLATTGGFVSTTGIAGLTLGGGLGWLMPKYGIAADNLLSAQLVTADGRTLTASEEEHADLFWALRGGGGNFGIVTSFTYRLYPVGPIVTAGLVAHPFTAARELLRFYREFAERSSDELLVIAGLLHAPDHSGAKLTAAVVCHIGEPEQARRELAPLLELGEPAMVEVGPMPYPVVNTMFDAEYPRGALNYWKSSFVEALSDELIDTLIERFAVVPSPTTALVFEHFHGAVTRVPVDATAFPHRQEGFDLLITSVWYDPAETPPNVAWTQETYEAVHPFVAARRYVGYLSADDTGEERALLAYGPNYERLRRVKAAYDPENVFHLNTNIPPPDR